MKTTDTTEKIAVILTVTSQPEVYHGEKTGATQYRAEATRDGLTQEQWCSLNSVLGRSTTSPASAVTDWNRRAREDGHEVTGTLEAPAPAPAPAPARHPTESRETVTTPSGVQVFRDLGRQVFRDLILEQDTRDFLETLLSCADSPEEDERPFKDATIHDFAPEFAGAVSLFLDEVRDRLETKFAPWSPLEDCERSFGGNVFFSLSGHGCGFFDESHIDGGAVQAGLVEVTGGDSYRFEDLENDLHKDESGKIDLSRLPQYLEESRAKLFTLPGDLA